MANSYSAPNCLIDTDTTLSAFETATGHTVTTADVIFVHTGATLTVDVARPFLIAKHGETSTGDPGAGNRRGNITFNANITTTFDGNATATNSGLKSSPGTAGVETKSNTITILGTAAQPTIFTNSAGAYSATKRYFINWVYGVFGAMGVWQEKYPSGASNAGNFFLPNNSTYTTASSFNLGYITFTTGNNGATAQVLFAAAVNAVFNIPTTIESVIVDNSAQTTSGYGAYVWYIVVTGTSTFDSEALLVINAYKFMGGNVAATSACIELFRVAANTTVYSASRRWSTTDIRPTQVVPADLAIADAGNGKGGLATISNAGSYAATDMLRIYASDGTTVIGCGTFADYTANSGIYCDAVTLGTLRSGDKAAATSDGYVFSAFSGAAANWTPTATVCPPCPSIDPPICLGVIDATPWAQGALLVRFYEMFCVDGLPYRYDFHVKRTLSGPLTLAEINSGAYYSCSFYNDQINPDLYVGSPFGDPGIASVSLSLESFGDAGDNVHPFTNQQYQIAVRAVAINGGLVAEDDNDAVCLGISSGMGGPAHVIIDQWPCLEFCDSPLTINVGNMPSSLAVNVGALPKIVLPEVPVLQVQLHKRRGG